MGARYSIVPGDPRVHKGDVLALAARNLPEASESRYAKYYEGNPLGAPRFVLAQEIDSQRFVGMAALFPTALRVRGALVPGAITGDFVVDAEHRGFGPAIALQRSLLSVLGRSELKCAFGRPNQFSEPIISRVGYADLGRLTRFVKLLKSDVIVGRYIHQAIAARAASALSSVVFDPALRLTSRDRRHRRSTAFSVERPDTFDDRFLKLWETVWRQYRVTGERNCDLLNWKYEMTTRARGLPRKYSLFALMATDHIVAGYIVYRSKAKLRHIVDIAFMPSEQVLDVHLAEFILQARDEGASAISLLYLGPHTLLTRSLRAHGFVRRVDEFRLRLFVRGDVRLAADLLDRDSWYFLIGETDV